jgi:hypothetical protein
VFTYSKENFTGAFEYLARIEACRSTMDGLGVSELRQMIPCNINAFIKHERKGQKRFQVTSERLALDTAHVIARYFWQLKISKRL